MRLETRQGRLQVNTEMQEAVTLLHKGVLAMNDALANIAKDMRSQPEYAASVAALEQQIEQNKKSLAMNEAYAELVRTFTKMAEEK